MIKKLMVYRIGDRPELPIEIISLLGKEKTGGNPFDARSAGKGGINANLCNSASEKVDVAVFGFRRIKHVDFPDAKVFPELGNMLYD